MSGPGGLVRGVTGAAALALLLVPLVLHAAELAPADTASVDDGRLLEREFFLLGADSRSLTLAHGDLDPGSFRLTVAGEVWRAGRDYRLRARSGQVVPLRTWTATGSVTAVAEYWFRPGGIRSRIGLRVMAPPPGRTESGEVVLPEVEEAWTLDQGGDLDVRGSKAIFVSSGNRRELTVDQNLRINVSGQLTSDIYVRAALSDDNLPVVPEGNTEELKDIDKVLVELEARRWKAVLGDFMALRGGTLFGNYRRKLQGFSMEARPGQGRVEALFGSPRGLYRTVEFRGQESNQGPYFLGTGEASQNLFVVAGTELVTLDGETLTRGANRDYVIDYVRGTVTFTFRRLITADTIIVVEFEEGEGPYSRGVVGAGGGLVFGLLGAPGNVGVRMTRERDDATRLRAGELSPEDEAVLAAAGNDPLAAVASGATEVDPGTGTYDKVDTGDDTYFVYAEDGGDWDVQFYFAGSGQADYELTNLTETGVRVYTWVGDGLGTYGVGRLLPLPDSHSLFSLSADVGDTVGAVLHAEWHLSKLDGNTLSDIDDDQTDGQAVHLRGDSGALGLLGGELRAVAAWEQRDDRFAPFLLQKTVYDYEGWGLGDRARREGFLEEADAELDGDVSWRVGGPGASLAIMGELASLSHGPSLTADRYGARGTWELAGGRGRHAWRQATSVDDEDPLDVLRQDQDHQLSWLVGPLVPRVRWLDVSWRDDARTGSGGRGYSREELTAGLGARPGRDWRWDLAFTRGLVDSLREANWDLERDTRTWQGNLASPRFLGMRVVADATLREVLRPDGEDETTRLAHADLSGTWTDIGSDWSLGYSVDNSRAEVLARQVVYVGENQGRYDENGNFVGEGRGDYELILAGTDSLVATTAVASDVAWRQDFGFLGRDRIWGAWVSQTRAGVEARSTTDDVRSLLLLKPSAIFDPEHTVLGRVVLSQDVTLLRHVQTWDLRWRFDYLEAMDRQFAQGRADRLQRNHTITATWNPSPTVSLRARGNHDDDSRDTDAELNPTQLGYDSLIKRIELETSWRPVAGSRAALAVEYLTRDDAVSDVHQTEIALRPSVRWQLAETWSLQGEVRVSDVKSTEPTGVRRPFFYPSPGTNVEATSRLGWEPSRYLTFALAYFARKPGGRQWQHDLRLESTARF